MTIHLLHPSRRTPLHRDHRVAVDPSAYAQSLHAYAAPTLTAPSLRA
jgi:hypothetical protein